MTLREIETQARALGDARIHLSTLVASLQAELNAAKRNYLAPIKRAVAKAAGMQQLLTQMVKDTPELFEKPRSHVFHGIKVGYQKNRGGISWEDPDRVCELIRKHFPDDADDLIRTKESPDKKALEKLCVGDLKRLACAIVEPFDEVVVRAVNDEVDKLVDTLLEDAAEAAKDKEVS